MNESSSPHGFVAPEPSELAPLFPGYDIHHLIAVGGMGAVYSATQKSLDRTVAIKILPLELSADAEFRTGFEAEAKAMARLNHPNLIGVFDFGEINGMLYIVMEFVPGKSLHHSAHGLAVEPQEVVRLVTGVCNGLAHAHENGILHRDIKPSNILLTLQAEPKIGDFGLARPVEHRTEEGAVIFGTPGYTAPEVVNTPGTVDHRADLFSVGVLLHELLTGKLPADDPRPASLISECDPRFDTIILRATHPQPEYRYASAAEFAGDLQKIIDAPKTAPMATVLAASKGGVARPPMPRRSTTTVVKRKGLNLTWVGPLLAISIMAFCWYKFMNMKPRVIMIEDPAAKTSPTGKTAMVAEREPEIPDESPATLEAMQLPSRPPLNPPVPSALDSAKAQEISAAGEKARDNAITSVYEATDLSSLRKKIGQLATVKGQVLKAGSNNFGAMRFLNFTEPYENSLSVMTLVSDAPDEFTDVKLQFYVGKSVQFTGIVAEHKNAFQIRLRSLAELKILEDGQITGIASNGADSSDETRKTPHGVPSDAKYFNGKWYRVYEEKCSWTEARDNCAKRGGLLVVIPDEQTQTFITKLASAKMLWIGATDEKKEGTWMWVNGTEVKIKFFNPGAPNNYPDEHYLAMNFRRADGNWDDFTNRRGDIIGYICEWPDRASPAFAAVNSTKQIQQPTINGEVLFEGETLKVIDTKGGRAEIQNMVGFGNYWSKGAQLWWRDANIGSTLTLMLPVGSKGKYQLKGALTKAGDYGIVSIGLDHKEVLSIFDGYNAGKVIRSDELDWGNHDLEAGNHKLTFTITGTNPRAQKKYMVGLDYVKLETVPKSGNSTPNANAPLGPRTWRKASTGETITAELLSKTSDNSEITLLLQGVPKPIRSQVDVFSQDDRKYIEAWTPPVAKKDVDAGPSGSVPPSPSNLEKKPRAIGVSVEGLTGRRFVYGAITDRGHRYYWAVTLAANGVIQESRYLTNESTWTIDSKGYLNFVASDGRVSTIFQKATWESGLVDFKGSYQFGDTKHVLLELKPCSARDALLSAQRLSKNGFVLTTRVPFERDASVLRFERSGAIIGAKFDAKPTWQVSQQGHLGIKTSGGVIQAVFDTFYTFKNGEFLLLEGPSKVRNGAVCQLLEKDDRGE